MTDAALLGTLRQHVLETVRSVTPPGPVALLDFPDYANPGDSAIWLGAMDCLAALGHDRPAYVSDMRSFDEGSLRRSLPTGTILLTGGGNFGDLWPRHQAFRERILRTFRDYAIVQLPQTLQFESPSAIASARQSFSDHQRCSLLVRDQRSLELAKGFGCYSALCPDLALCLAPERIRAIAPNERTDDAGTVLWLMRRDHESAGAHAPATAWVSDWAQAPRSTQERIASRLRDYLTRNGSVETPSLVSRGAQRVLATMLPSLAQRHLVRACRLLRSARIVVTDRLHGHVLALLLGVRHVVIGDRYGKLRRFVDTWTAASSLMRWADNVEDAQSLAQSLARDSVRVPA